MKVEVYRAATAIECLVGQGAARRGGAGWRRSGRAGAGEAGRLQVDLHTGTASSGVGAPLLQVGYLYLTDPPRLHALMDHLGLEPPPPAAAVATRSADLLGGSDSEGAGSGRDAGA